MDKEISLVNWAHEFLDKWLDNREFVFPNVIQQKEWGALPVPDVLNPMEADWLAGAISSIGYQQCMAIAFEHVGIPETELLHVSRDSLLRFNGGNSFRSVIFTSLDEGFLYFKDEANRYYLVCGEQNFVAQAYRCSLETAKLMYFDQWVNTDINSVGERSFLTKIWERYIVESAPKDIV